MGWDDYNIFAGNYFTEITHMNSLNALRLALFERAERVGIDIPVRLRKKVVRMADVNWLNDFETLLSTCIPYYINYFDTEKPYFTESSLISAIGDTEKINPGRFIEFQWAYQRYKMINCLLVRHYTLIANTHGSWNNAEAGVYLGNFTPGFYTIKYIAGAYNCWSTDYNSASWNTGTPAQNRWRYNLYIATGDNTLSRMNNWTRLQNFSNPDNGGAFIPRTYDEAEAYFAGKKERVYLSGDSYFILGDKTSYMADNGGTVTIAILGYNDTNIFEFVAHDSDNDGVPDWYEIEIDGTDPEDPASVVDNDGDGYPDYTEKLYGSDPENSEDTPEVIDNEEDIININNPDPGRSTIDSLFACFTYGINGGTVTCYDNSAGSISSYHWSASNGASGSGRKFSTTFDAGTHTISLYVTESVTGNISNTYTRTFKISQEDINKNKKVPVKKITDTYNTLKVWWGKASCLTDDTVTFYIIWTGDTTGVTFTYTTPAGVTSSVFTAQYSQAITVTEVGEYYVTVTLTSTGGTITKSAKLTVINKNSADGQEVQGWRDIQSSGEVNISFHGVDDSLGLAGRTQTECESTFGAAFFGHSILISPLTDTLWIVSIDGELKSYCTKGGFGSYTNSYGRWTVTGWEEGDEIPIDIPADEGNEGLVELTGYVGSYNIPVNSPDTVYSITTPSYGTLTCIANSSAYLAPGLPANNGFGLIVNGTYAPFGSAILTFSSGGQIPMYFYDGGYPDPAGYSDNSGSCNVVITWSAT